MNPISQPLRDLINQDKYQSRYIQTKNDTIFLKEFLSRIDVVNIFEPKHAQNSPEEFAHISELFSFGWGGVLRMMLKNIELSDISPIFISNPDSITWIDNEILIAGKISLIKQMLDYEKADIINITTNNNKEFFFDYKNERNGVEFFDQLSLNFYKKEIVEQAISEKKAKSQFNVEEINQQLKSIILNPLGIFISYNTTPDIDNYYNKIGHYHLLRMQGYDDFSDSDQFGGIPYSMYIDIIELIIGTAFMHVDACIELCKSNPSVDIHNILSYEGTKQKIVETYSNYLDLPEKEIDQIFSCITLNKENGEKYLSLPSVPPPIYIQTSKTQITRSIAGCLNNPFKFLNFELKRKYKSDYDVAVNMREDRFRKDLFYLFPQDRIVKIPKGINITTNNSKTDIDAILYDTVTHTLGLVQLKWQDPFGHSMKERFSRISNLFPKANEWIFKVNDWLQSNTEKTVLNALQITKLAPNSKEIKNVCVFIISRNQMNFTAIEINDYAAWASWHQLIEAKARIKATFDDPIKELFTQIKLWGTNEPMRKDQLPKVDENFKIEIEDYKLSYRKK